MDHHRHRIRLPEGAEGLGEGDPAGWSGPQAGRGADRRHTLSPGSSGARSLAAGVVGAAGVHAGGWNPTLPRDLERPRPRVVRGAPDRGRHGPGTRRKGRSTDAGEAIVTWGYTPAARGGEDRARSRSSPRPSRPRTRGLSGHAARLGTKSTLLRRPRHARDHTEHRALARHERTSPRPLPGEPVELAGARRGPRPPRTRSPLPRLRRARR